MQLTRRSFLISAAAAAYAPAFLGATDKAGTKAPILGQGEHQYEAIHDWGELPHHQVPVSYTHLDVYKRQTRDRSFCGAISPTPAREFCA